jgi:hypothetical protein
LIWISLALTRYSLVTPFRILAALAGVRLAADPVHGDRERLVRLLRDGAVGHRARLEALHDCLGGLDFREGDRVAALEIQQAAQRAEISPLVVDQLGVGLEGGLAVVAHRLLEGVDRLGGEEVGFPV